MHPASYKKVLLQPRRLAAVASLLIAAAGASVHAQDNIRAGSGRVVLENVRHPVTGRIYDQVLLTGPSVTVAANPDQIVRVSFLDDNEDITQVEFSGSGTVTVALDPATYCDPAPPTKYNQPDVSYVKGHATLRVNGAAADTFVCIFSVGRGNAVNQSLFRDDATYDAMADIQLLQIDGPAIGAILTGNVRYSGAADATGIDAAGTAVRYRAIIGDLDACDNAIPRLRIGSSSPLEWDAGALLVAGGLLVQSNGALVDVSASDGTPLARIRSTAGTLSSGTLLPARDPLADFTSARAGAVVVDNVARSTRAYLPVSFDELRASPAFALFDFGVESIEFSGGNKGTGKLIDHPTILGVRCSVELAFNYEYSVDASNRNRATLKLDWGGIVFSNEVTAQLVLEHGASAPMKVFVNTLVADLTAAIEFTSPNAGTATFTEMLAKNKEANESYSGSFSRDQPLDLRPY